ncbi:MAG: DUF2809 domain-containing protein [Armatimonas sp.]
MKLRNLWPALIVFLIGLSTRPLGRVAHWLSDPLGGILYALFLTRLIRFLAPKVRPERLALGVFLFCAIIEFCQSLQMPWLVALRHNRLGNLVLGTGFDPVDFLWYAIGSGLSFLWDRKSDSSAGLKPTSR